MAKVIKNLDDLIELCHEIGIKVLLEPEGRWKDWSYAGWRQNFEGENILVLSYTSFWPTKCFAVIKGLHKLEEARYIKIVEMKDPPEHYKDTEQVFNDAIVEIIK